MKNLIGKVVLFKPRIEDYESEIDEGMKMRVINIEENFDEYCHRIWFDSSEFIEHNKTKMKSNYYSRETHEPVLTALEAGWWPKNEKHSVFFEKGEDISPWFDVVEEPVLKVGSPCEILINQQGAVMVNAGHIYKLGEGVAAIEIDMHTKRGEVGAYVGGDSSKGPGIILGISDESLHFDKEKKDLGTEIYFPEFKGWNVWCAEYCRYTVTVCLCKHNIKL